MLVFDVFEQWDTGGTGWGGGLAPSAVTVSVTSSGGEAVIRIRRVIDWSADLASARLCCSLP